MTTPLQLNDYFFDRLVFQAFPITVQEGQEPIKNNVRLDTEVIEDKESNTTHVSLHIYLNTDNEIAGKAPYSCEMRIIGIYSVDPQIPEQDRDRLIKIIGVTNLYGIARGVIGQFTSIGPYGKMVLPNFNVLERPNNDKETPPLKCD